MSALKPRTHYEINGLDYILVDDYYNPVIELPERDDRPIGKWGWMHRAYLEETNRIRLTDLILTGELQHLPCRPQRTDTGRYLLIVKQMAKAEGVTEDLKRQSQMDWIKVMNGIASRAKEIIKNEMT